MTKRTKPDSNQADIAAAFNACGMMFVDLHDVPANLPELAGLPDGAAIDPSALTVICDDTALVEKQLMETPGVRAVLRGGTTWVEIKTDKGDLRKAQADWWTYHELMPFVVRGADTVLNLFGR